jgi:uncharacterized metal-binding protein YceD (DUF177 family)
MTQTNDQGFADIPLTEPFRVAGLSSRKPNRFDLQPNAKTRAALAEYLGITAIPKLRFAGMISPKGRNDFVLEAVLEAVVEQPCSISLEPVVTPLREEVLRVYLAKWDIPTNDEMEMPEDDSSEPLGETIDAGHVAVEALTLALPPFPRAPGAVLDVAEFTAPGAAPLRDSDLKPFAGLAALKAKLEKPENEAE